MLSRIHQLFCVFFDSSIYNTMCHSDRQWCWLLFGRNMNVLTTMIIPFCNNNKIHFMISIFSSSKQKRGTSPNIFWTNPNPNLWQQVCIFSSNREMVGKTSLHYIKVHFTMRFFLHRNVYSFCIWPVWQVLTTCFAIYWQKRMAEVSLVWAKFVAPVNNHCHVS